jgi:ribosome-associated protein
VKPRVAARRAAKPRSAPSRRREVPLLGDVLAQLEDAKAEDIVTLDLEGKASIADRLVIASGRSNRHVGAIAEQLVQKLKDAGHRNLRVEGLPHADWVLVDAGDVVVHIFRPEVRSFYNLEKLWSDHAPDERLAS